ncbi:hypothetical protein GQ600_1350 [Phytophthora cactorum]|nr:hypothetical protein GQ600_1350 [Phytophthora cactorum]
MSCDWMKTKLKCTSTGESSGSMAGVLYVAVVSRMLDLADTAFHWLPSYLRGGPSTRRSIYTPKEDSIASVYAGGATSRATATPIMATDMPRVPKRNFKSKTNVSL